jgi:hypothetical protein
MSTHAVAEWDAHVAANPNDTLATQIATLDVAPADQLVLSPLYIRRVQDIRIATRQTILDRITELQDPNTVAGGELLVTAGMDGMLGTDDDETDCTATCPILFTTYFT